MPLQGSYAWRLFRQEREEREEREERHLNDFPHARYAHLNVWTSAASDTNAGRAHVAHSRSEDKFT